MRKELMRSRGELRQYISELADDLRIVEKMYDDYTDLTYNFSTEYCDTADGVNILTAIKYLYLTLNHDVCMGGVNVGDALNTAFFLLGSEGTLEEAIAGEALEALIDTYHIEITHQREVIKGMKSEGESRTYITELEGELLVLANMLQEYYTLTHDGKLGGGALGDALSRLSDSYEEEIEKQHKVLGIMKSKHELEKYITELEGELHIIESFHAVASNTLRHDGGDSVSVMLEPFIQSYSDVIEVQRKLYSEVYGAPSRGTLLNQLDALSGELVIATKMKRLYDSLKLHGGSSCFDTDDAIDSLIHAYDKLIDDQLVLIEEYDGKG